MLKLIPRSLVCALLLALFRIVDAYAQAGISTSTLKGTISDQSGAIVGGATLTARSVECGTRRSTQTGAEGSHHILLLQPGVYELSVEAVGFQTQVLHNVVLTVGQEVVFDVQMRVGEVANEISVNIDLPLIEIERTQQANTIERRQIVNLPNPSRSFTEYLFTLPGVASNSTAFSQNAGRTVIAAPASGISIGGGNGRSNYISIDGGEDEYGTGTLRIGNLSVEAVQDFQVNRNGFNAGYGFTTGTAVNVVTRSGANDLHGGGYVFYRSQKTSGRNAFDFHPQRPFEQRVFPGFTLGGPLARNKAFFFTSYEALKLDEAKIRNYTGNAAILTATAAQNDYLASLESGPNAHDNTRRIALNLRPLLITTNYPTTMKILRESEAGLTAPSRKHDWSMKLDFQPSEKE